MPAISITVLRSLRLFDFRCFAQIDLEASPQGVILTGANAQGKTSILESICVLVRLQSPRSSRMSNLARIGGSGKFGITGDPWGSERQVRSAGAGCRQYVDGDERPNRSDYLADGGLVVWIGNEDLTLVRGPAEERRRYIDFIGAQADPTYRRSWSRYRRALRAKNLLLKEDRPRDAEIRSYDELLVEHGTVMMACRARLIDQLAPLAAASQSTIAGTGESLKMRYQPAAGDDLRTAIEEARDREARLRQAVAGPHRDEITLELNGMSAADHASEGQQRTIALALKLAQGSLLESIGRHPPLYLIDDIFGELDPQRRNALMHHLPGTAQKWITTTHLGWLAETPGLNDLARLHVSHGGCAAESS
ncbi:MAG: DNA replication and repair protein RecF [Verrucomicrobia bacterium]|nr:DNA replication and repair protein RecF [Verrucomicrobiota bacterium]